MTIARWPRRLMALTSLSIRFIRSLHFPRFLSSEVRTSHYCLLMTVSLESWRMYGRNSLFVGQSDLEARFGAEAAADGGYTLRYNIAPGDNLEIITNEAEDEIDEYHWDSFSSGQTSQRKASSPPARRPQTRNTFSRRYGSLGRVSSSRRDFTSSKHGMAVPNDRIVSIVRMARRSRWLVSGKSGKATTTRSRA